MEKARKEQMTSNVNEIIEHVANNPTFRFNLAVTLFTTTALDRYAHVLFYISKFTLDENGAPVWRGEGERPCALDDTNKMRITVVEAMRCAAAVWEMYAGNDANGGGEFEFGMSLHDFAECYRPNNSPTSEMHVELMTQMFTLITDLKHRFLDRFENEPYCSTEMDDPVPDDVTLAEEEKEGYHDMQCEVCCDRFLQRNDCCVSDLLGFKGFVEDDTLQGSRKQRYVSGHRLMQKTYEATSLQQENMHAEGRAHANRFDKKPVGLDRRAVLQVLLLLVRCWTARGGRDFAFKPQRVVQNFKEALKRVTYTKPNYVGRVKEVWKWKQLSGQDARFKRI